MHATTEVVKDKDGTAKVKLHLLSSFFATDGTRKAKVADPVFS